MILEARKEGTRSSELAVSTTKSGADGASVARRERIGDSKWRRIGVSKGAF
jgi:hypothetical protein